MITTASIVFWILNRSKNYRGLSRTFFLINVQGSHRFEVPNGHCMRVTSGSTGATPISTMQLVTSFCETLIHQLFFGRF